MGQLLWLQGLDHFQGDEKQSKPCPGYYNRAISHLLVIQKDRECFRIISKGCMCLGKRLSW